MEEQEHKVEHYNAIPKPPDWFTALISFQADVLHNCFITLCSPFFSLLSIASDSYHRADQTTATVETALQNVPSNVTHGSSILLKKIWLGLLGAAQVCMVLVLVMVVAALVGIGLVQVWLEEPVFLREKMFFDYTDSNPKALFCVNGGGEVDLDGNNSCKKKQMAFHVGHTFHVYLVLLMPDSDFNRHVGVFQLTAELLSTDGNVIAKSSQPVMVYYRSLPVRLARTFFLGIPLLLGISSETQKLSIELLRYKGHPKTEAIRVTLAPRAGTSSLPQLYEAELVMNSQLPWTKRLVHNWKWTLYVWTSLYLYIMFLVVVFGFFKPRLFPVTTASSNDRDERERGIDESHEPLITGRADPHEVSNLLSKWQQSKRKRKAFFLQKDISDIPGSSASSMSLTREETSAVIDDDDAGDSESVCLLEVE